MNTTTPRAVTALLALLPCAFLTGRAQDLHGGWTQDFHLSGRTLSPSGASRYFNLNPGFRLVLASPNTTLLITVLNETQRFGKVEARVVEERETVDGALYEVARNYYARDPATGDVFYFGEDVDFYRGGQVVTHKGSWRAYENGNRPGLIMPGTPSVGLRYAQELAPGVALDRAEITSVTATLDTPAGRLTDCVLIRETNPLEPGLAETKTYAPGLGLVQDQQLRLAHSDSVAPATK